jgi:hypothetical protein
VRLRIEGRDLPGLSCGPGPDYPDGHKNIHVAVQGRKGPQDLLGVTPGDASGAVWDLECEAIGEPPGTDLRGPQIQGGPGNRFIYLSWGVVGDNGAFRMFRRAKLMLADIPAATMSKAVETGLLTCGLGLTDDKANPVCARPPGVQWSAGRQAGSGRLGPRRSSMPPS